MDQNFLEAQGADVGETVIYQDNMSTIKLAENGRASAGKRSRHLNIKYFFITDLIRNKQISVKYCPTDQNLADYMSKPLTGRKFHHDRQLLMNLPATETNLATGVCGTYGQTERILHRRIISQRSQQQSRKCHN